MIEIKNKTSKFYNSFLINRHRFVRPLLFGILLLSLVIGASYRIIDVEENFSVTNGFEFFVNMASHFWTQPGGYNFEDSLKMKEKPDDYIFSRNTKEPATGSFENEKGWAFILSLIFKEGTKGIQNLAVTVVRYQLMLDLFVVVLLFWAGRSIAGPLGGGLAAILYALFKPSINMTSWVVHYYWAIPLSALSLFFWTVVYRPEERTYSLRVSSLLFLLYGMAMGFAVSVRLNFLFLPLFLSPLIFIREQTSKRALVLFLAMLIGQGVMLAPQAALTYKWYDKPTLTTRGIWHGVISGLGAYPNPFGIRDTGDLTAVNWAISQGGPDLNGPGGGIQEYDKFMKKEAIRLVKKRPDIFLKNFRVNFYDGMTVTPKYRGRFIDGPHFLGIMDTKKDAFDIKKNRLLYYFPGLVLFSIVILFFFWRERFWPLSAVVLQGLYTLGILCIYFPPGDQHITVYFPTFVLLMAVSVAVLVRGIMSIPEGILRCWVNNREMRCWPLLVARGCFREEWDKEYSPVRIEESEPIIKLPVEWQRRKWLVISSGIAILFVGLFIARIGKNIVYEMPDAKTVQTLDSLLEPEKTGGFESWSSGESSIPDEWNCAYGKGGGVYRATGAEKVRVGTSSAEVHPDSVENSRLVFNVTNDILYYLIGKTITVTGWVRSDNNRADKVYLKLNNGDPSRYLYAYYQNSGEWERLVLTYTVPDDITGMAICLNVDSGADAPVYFDGIEMSYAPRYTD